MSGITIFSEKRRIADSVFNWYKQYNRNNQEVEETFLGEIDAKTSDGRIELILLARLFSQYMLREERAISIWSELKNWFQQEGLGYGEIFRNQNSLGVAKFSRKLSALGFPGNPFDLMSNLDLAMDRLRSENGEIEFEKKDNWKDTVANLADSFRGTGIKQKVFWLFRVLKQTGEWSDIPGEYCCVSDIHVKEFLRKTGFVSDPEADLFLNSKAIWEYFNAPFDEKLYDLAVFRFARNHGCKKCKVTECNSSYVEKCAMR